MQAQLRTRVRNVLAEARFPLREPVLRAAWRGYERAVTVRDALRPDGPPLAEDGLPLPPPGLQVLVSGRADPAFFLRSGRAHSRFIRELLAANGTELTKLEAILDLGCGCGRIARWWHDLDGPTVYACDYNAKLAGWCERNLRFLSVARNQLEPPLPYASQSLDLVYALSVFTHLTEDQQRRWIGELHRVLRPGGLALMTVNGEAYAGKLSAGERRRFDAGQVVTRFENGSGTNMCATYHPPRYVETRMLEGFELLDAVRPSEDPQRAVEDLAQDTYLARR